jgi:predicted nucleic acid-binding protein
MTGLRFFLDTSALAELYHEADRTEFVSRLSRVEMESVFAIKVRIGALDEAERSPALRRLRADIARSRLIVGPPIEPKHYRAAATLLRFHGVSRGLRTLDALRLAIALEMLEASSISLILPADKRLCEVAEACGCPAIDPAQPGLIEG